MPLSSFQFQHAQSITRSPEFAGWCVEPWQMIPAPRSLTGARKEPYTILYSWFTRDGALICERVAENAVMWRKQFPAIIHSEGVSNV